MLILVAGVQVEYTLSVGNLAMGSGSKLGLTR